ncbi:MAG: dihydropteroate synthase [Planctomycetota bacterium]|nr:MAG: dihydropteroate synthase [Planctomycetota bacterium]
MAVLNVTPDSFSDGGSIATPADAVRAARAAADAGADLLDIGGESTRPGAGAVPEAEQIARVAPAIRAVREAGLDAPITVDTTRAAVARAALDAGADAVNDVSAGLDDPAMLPLIARRRVGVVLMHRRSAPARDRYSDRYVAEPDYGPAGVVRAVRDFLAERLGAARDAGVAPDSIAVDPGLGFGKSVGQNFELLASIDRLVTLGAPVLVGASRKSFLGAVTGEADPARRLSESIAAAVAARLGGASIVRAHDAGPHRRALAAADAVRAARMGRVWPG